MNIGTDRIIVVEFPASSSASRTANIPTAYQGKVMVMGFAVESDSGYTFTPFPEAYNPYIKIETGGNTVTMYNAPSSYNNRKIYGYLLYTDN